MKNSMLFIFIPIFSTSCTQHFISYVKTPSNKPLYSISDMLTETGLINPPEEAQKEDIPKKSYPETNLIPKGPQLEKIAHTLEVSNNSYFNIKVNTKNYLLASPYYSSPGIIYDSNLSQPKQGIFIFFIGKNSGEIKIRLYSPDGILEKEESWYIEVKPQDLEVDSTTPISNNT